MDRRAPLRRLRALLVTATVVALAGTGHLAGGGTLPPPALLLGLGAAVLLPVVSVTGRRLALGHLLTILGTAQLGLHEAFTQLSGAPACAPVAGGHSHGAHLAPGPAPACPAAAGQDVAAAALPGAEWAMPAGHALAVLVTAVVLGRAEAALWLAVEWLRPRLAPAPPARLLLRAPRPGVPAGDRPVPAWRGLRRDQVRGPPAATAA